MAVDDESTDAEHQVGSFSANLASRHFFADPQGNIPQSPYLTDDMYVFLFLCWFVSRLSLFGAQHRPTSLEVCTQVHDDNFIQV
ncbi:MAG: hypothetical protein UT64_C0050G0002 [Candidatus Falkowbacteria bacterium GW2011_GWF2_39_8]|uniref:Uncharacterized protein n=1 Tax=Candidatus Falkowbacteria bacterium GW2011_GWF2_39_8 TaxID=1618642 RepID=A0A0G0PUE8_9BACT|nr:MAG: hypothetical protein UT64_C0050G0002 [Candidatus Falkowbacteria bacterium GW2011_GWF2_39_8]